MWEAFTIGLSVALGFWGFLAGQWFMEWRRQKRDRKRFGI